MLNCKLRVGKTLYKNDLKAVAAARKKSLTTGRKVNVYLICKGLKRQEIDETCIRGKCTWDTPRERASVVRFSAPKKRRR